MALKQTLAATALALVICGCSNDTPAPPPGAVRPPDKAPAPTAKKEWTKQDKIDAINNSTLPAAQKQAEIAKISAGG